MLYGYKNTSFLTLLSVLLLLAPPLIAQADAPGQEKTGKEIDITMKNFKYVPHEIRVPAGEKVTLKFTNKGTVTHAFMAGRHVTENLKGYKEGLFSGVEVAKKTTSSAGTAQKSLMLEVAPGESATLTITMPESKKGSYEFG